MTFPSGPFTDLGVELQPPPEVRGAESRRVPIETDATRPNDFATFALNVPEFYRYLGRARRMGQLDEATEFVVRDVWLAAFKAGCTFAVERTAALSRPDVVEAIAVLAEVTRGTKDAD